MKYAGLEWKVPNENQRGQWTMLVCNEKSSMKNQWSNEKLSMKYPDLQWKSIEMHKASSEKSSS